MRAWTPAVVLGVAACGPTSEARLYAAICGGEPGPVPLLTLRHDESLPRGRALTEAGDDLLIPIFEHDEDVSTSLFPPEATGSRVVRLDRCAERSIVVARDISNLALMPTGHFVGYDGEASVWIDPVGARDPVPLRGSVIGAHAGGLVAVRVAGGAHDLVQLWLDEPDQVESETIAAGLGDRQRPLVDAKGWVSHVLSNTPSRELVEVDVAAREATVLTPEVDRFSTFDQRYILIEDTKGRQELAAPLQHRVLDRSSGADVVLTPGHWHRSFTVFRGATFIAIDVTQGAPITETQLLFVPEFEPRTMIGDWRVEGQLDDGRRALTRSTASAREVFVLDDAWAEPSLIYAPGDWVEVRVEDSRIFVLTYEPGERSLQCPRRLEVPLDGGDPVPAPTRLCGELRFGDGRFVGTSPLQETITGAMVLVDLHDRHETLATFVERQLWNYNPAAYEGESLPEPDFFYVVREPGGTQNGLWRARLSPAAGE